MSPGHKTGHDQRPPISPLHPRVVAVSEGKLIAGQLGNLQELLVAASVIEDAASTSNWHYDPTGCLGQHSK